MISTEKLFEGYRSMLRIRLAEQKIAEDFLANKIFSFLHLYIGQEAIAAGVSLALEPRDKAFGNHRSHGHYLAKGGDLYRMFCEIYGKADGCCRAKGGSMHMLDRSAGFMGSTPILAAAAPLAAGFAFTQKRNGERNITVVYIGDGASEEGVFYETMNLAAVWKLPILFVIENNLYSVASPETDRRANGFSRQKLVNGLGLPFLEVDGSSLEEIYKAAIDARSTIVNGGSPFVIEARVYREMAHSGPICDENTRIVDIKQVRQAADPVINTRFILAGRGIADETLTAIEADVRFEISEAFSKAKGAASPEPSEMLEDVYA